MTVQSGHFGERTPFFRYAVLDGRSRRQNIQLRNVYGEYLKSSALFRIFLSETFQMKNFYRSIASGSILCFLLVLTTLIQMAQVLFLFPRYLFILSSALYKDLMKNYEVAWATQRLMEKDTLKYRIPYRSRPFLPVQDKTNVYYPITKHRSV